MTLNFTFRLLIALLKFKHKCCFLSFVSGCEKAYKVAFFKIHSEKRIKDDKRFIFILKQLFLEKEFKTIFHGKRGN